MVVNINNVLMYHPAIGRYLCIHLTGILPANKIMLQQRCHNIILWLPQHCDKMLWQRSNRCCYLHCHNVLPKPYGTFPQPLDNFLPQPYRNIPTIFLQPFYIWLLFKMFFLTTFLYMAII